MAYLPPMPYQVNMQRIGPLRRYNLGKDIMGLLCSDLWAYQAETLGDAMDMGVNTVVQLVFLAVRGMPSCSIKRKSIIQKSESCGISRFTSYISR